MTPTLLLTVAVLLGDAPAPDTSAVVEPTLAVLLGGDWVGEWERGGERTAGARLRRGRLTFPTGLAWSPQLHIVDAGHGRFRGTLNTLPIVGIWKFEHGVLTLCICEERRGYPLRFAGDEWCEMVRLRGVPTGDQ